MHNHGIILALKGTNGIGDPAHLLENVIFWGKTKMGELCCIMQSFMEGTILSNGIFLKDQLFHFGEFNV